MIQTKGVILHFIELEYEIMMERIMGQEESEPHIKSVQWKNVVAYNILEMPCATAFKLGVLVVGILEQGGNEVKE